MRIIITLGLFLSFGVFADGHEADEPKYKPNKAEYYVNVFKDGKDMDDLMKWSMKWKKWASEGEAGEVFKNYTAAILVPYYGHSLKYQHQLKSLNTDCRRYRKGIPFLLY